MPVAERCLPFKVPIVEMERLAKLTHGPNGLLILDTLLSPIELLGNCHLALCLRREGGRHL